IRTAIGTVKARIEGTRWMKIVTAALKATPLVIKISES
ncbi:unnamed protein product, partial [marine sediment metagenome]